MEHLNLFCCGLKEFSGVSRLLTDTDRKYELRDFLDYVGLVKNRQFVPCGVIIFTQAGGTKTSYGYQFADFLTKNGLGKVETIPTFINPNTNRKIHTFFWYIDHKAVLDWYINNK